MIGIFSGTFDPITNGHLWVIKEGARLFRGNEFRVVVSDHPGKDCEFSREERIKMVKDSLTAHDLPKEIWVEETKPNEGIISFVKAAAEMKCKRMAGEFFLLRGIRDEEDFTYEQEIDQQIRDRTQSGLPTIFVMSPESLKYVSSSAAKWHAKHLDWNKVAEIVPSPVLEKLRGEPTSLGYIHAKPKPTSIYGGMSATPSKYPPLSDEEAKKVREHLTKSASILKPGRLNKSGSCRVVDWKEETPELSPAAKDYHAHLDKEAKERKTSEDRGITCMSTSGYTIPMDDIPPEKHISFPKDVAYKFDLNLATMNRHFEDVLRIGFVELAKKVTGDQVREILEDVGIDLVVSDKFYLIEIDVDEVKAIGERWVPCSRSVGPVIVEANHVLGNNTSFGELGPVIVIEGKHRLLDAIERGKKTIWAWVGSEAVLEHESRKEE